ncbi:Testis-expressed protein 19.2 [Lemmus lemmus]
MCPPVNIHRGAKGMSCLYAEWLYQLVHRDQMKICLACFKAAFLIVKNMLDMGDWEEEEWSAEPIELSEEESGPEEWIGQSCAEGQEDLLHIMWEFGSSGILTAGSVGTELEPDEAVPLDTGPEDADWTQALPWKLGSFYPCPHHIMPPLSWCDIFYFNPYPGQPILLELSPIWPMQLLVESLLVHLKFVVVLGDFDDICFLLSMRPCWAVRTQVHRWQILLDPGELRKAYLQNEPEQQDLNRWRLSILESSELGVELVPADCTLRKGGFKVHSYLPWHPDTPEDWSREPGERLFIKHIEPQRDLSYSLRRRFIDNFLS